MIKHVIGVGWHALSLLLTCAVIGAGIGILLGELTARSWERPYQIAFAEGAAGMGMIAAAVLGPICYLFLGRRVSLREFSAIVASRLIAGAVVAFAAWQIMVPIMTVLAGAIAVLTIRILRNGDLLPGNPTKA